MSPKIIDDQIIDPIGDSQPLKLTFYLIPNYRTNANISKTETQRYYCMLIETCMIAIEPAADHKTDDILQYKIGMMICGDSDWKQIS